MVRTATAGRPRRTQGTWPALVNPASACTPWFSPSRPALTTSTRLAHEAAGGTGRDAGGLGRVPRWPEPTGAADGPQPASASAAQAARTPSLRIPRSATVTGNHVPATYPAARWRPGLLRARRSPGRTAGAAAMPPGEKGAAVAGDGLAVAGQVAGTETMALQHAGQAVSLGSVRYPAP